MLRENELSCRIDVPVTRERKHLRERACECNSVANYSGDGVEVSYVGDFICTRPSRFLSRAAASCRRVAALKKPGELNQSDGLRIILTDNSASLNLP